MMKNKKMEEKYYINKWLNNEISEDELNEFKKLDSYNISKKIIDGISKLSVEEYAEDIAYIEFKNKLNDRNAKKSFVKDDVLLGKWLNNDLSEHELKKFQESEDYQEYKAITEGITKLGVEEYHEELAYSEFKQKLENRSSSNHKTIKISFTRYIAIAASFLLILSISYFMTNKTYETQLASQENILLPDNSRVILNAKSKLSYNKILFGINRRLNLDGEAFFEVQKGSSFSVLTNNGKVKVLGTKFNVTSRENYFETSCFEGKVSVTTSLDEKVLTKGKSVLYIDQIKEKDEDFNEDQPSWMQGMSRFKSTPLKYVLENIEIHYGTRFNIDPKIDTNNLFTGSFSHDDIESALENVFLPMGIDYNFDQKTSTIILKMK